MYFIRELNQIVGEKLQDWLDKELGNNGYYQPGFKWELSAVLCWFDADEEVRKTFKGG